MKNATRRLRAWAQAMGVGGWLTMLSAAAAAPHAPYSGLVVFGDSLSDTGNAGRFSDGPVWVEHVAAGIGAGAEPSDAGGSNYAVGGARLQGPTGARSLRAQADLFLRRGPADPRALHIVYGGGNDLRAAVGAPDARAILDGALRSLRGILDDLIAAGAREILVPNLPDIGRTPEMRALGPAAVAAATALSAAFNQGLEGVLRETEARHGLRVRRLDVFALTEQAAADPAAFGFDNVTEPCPRSGASGASAGCAGPQRHLFCDGIHPTAAGHARLGQEALRALAVPARAR